MIISHRYKFVFVHIPKTGGTSISKALRPALGPNDYHETLLAPKHYTGQQVRSKFFSCDLEWRSYLSFAFVRNPWDRIYSDYCYSKRMARVIHGFGPPGLEQWVQTIRRISDYSFERFVREVYLRNRMGTYQKYCQDGNGHDLLSFVGKFEVLQHDWNRVCRALELPQYSLPHENRSRQSNTEPSTGYREAYTAELRDLVAKHFEDDIDRFQYVF